MRGQVKRLVVVVALLMLTAVSIHSRNRFNVFTHSDFVGTVPLDSFYIKLDEYGISDLYTQNTDSASKYKNLCSLEVDFYAPHFYEWKYANGQWHHVGQQIPIGGGLTLWNAVRKSISGSMSAVNGDDLQGYVKNGNAVGRAVPSPVAPVNRDVQFVNPVVDTAGFMHTEFFKGTFYILRQAGIGTELSYDVKLLLADTTGEDTAVVAQMVFDNLRAQHHWRYACDTSIQKWSFYRYNDTLLAVFDGSDYTLYRTLGDTVPVPVHGDFCHTSTRTDLGYLENICYRDETDSVWCAIPYRFVKDIHRGDFDAPDQWQTFSTKVIALGVAADWFDFAYRVYWTGNDSLYLDSLFVYNDMGHAFDTLADLHKGEVADSIETWYDNHTYAKGNVNGVYLIDEPFGVEVQTFRRMNNVLGEVSNSGDYPTEQITTLGAFNGTNPDTLGGKYFDTYIYYSDADFFNFDLYPNFAFYSSSSEEDDYTNIQCMMEKNILHMEIAIERVQDIINGGISPMSYWVTLPTFDGWELRKPEYGPGYYKKMRMYTAEEMRAIVNLALAYGAKGIGYWEYLSRWASTQSYAPEDSLPPKPRSADLEALSSGGCTGLPDDWCTIPACSCSTTGSPPPSTGMVYYDNGDPMDLALWNAYKSINMYLDSMAYFFNNATWKSAGRWTDNLASMSVSFIDSIKTLTQYDSAFVQVAFFEKDTCDYAYIVNRRVMNDPPDVDSQTVRLFMEDGPGLYEVWDVYANSCDSVFDSAGVLIYDLYLDPGHAKLLRRNKIRDSNWFGTLTKDWTWTPGATINMVGDVTVYYGKKLTIQSNRVSVPAYYDSLGGGVDADKVEMWVYGTLRLEGGANNRIELGPDTAADSSWYGIMTLSYGEVFADNAYIKNAYLGLGLGEYGDDTVTNCRFENCFMYGLYAKGDKAFIYQDTFAITREITTGYGLYATGADLPSVISKCVFENPMRSMRLYNSDLTVDDCVFKEYDYHSSGSGGYPAISAAYSDGSIDNCEFNNSVKGVYVENGADISIDGCEFVSDSAHGSDEDPFMYIAIHGTPTASSCKVRNSCFKPSKFRYVLTDSTVFDLGIVDSDSGLNTFHVNLVPKRPPSGPPWWDYPGEAVDNTSGSGIEAEGNWWDNDALIYWISGTVDTTPSLSQVTYGCQYTGGNPPKIAGGVSTDEPLPNRFTVRQNYPNPFNPITIIGFDLPERVKVNLEVYNVLGQRVITLADREMDAGVYNIEWDGSDEQGKPVATGVYLYKLAAGDFVETRKMMLIK